VRFRHACGAVCDKAIEYLVDVRGDPARGTLFRWTYSGNSSANANVPVALRALMPANTSTRSAD
jgi:hypothetical protein